jgi:hypothetical protein
MKKQIFLIMFLLVSSVAWAQNLTKSGVLKINIRSAGAIAQDNQVKGYYHFYMVEKADRKNNNYLLSVSDENLREINSINIVRPTYYTLVEGAFNGSNFAFLFYDSKSKSVEIVSYDRTLKQLGTVTKKVGNQYAQAAFNLISTGEDASQSYLIPVKEKGFLYYGAQVDSYNFEIDFYDNAMKKAWSYAAAKNSRKVESAGDIFQDDQFIGSMIASKPSMMSNDLAFELLVQDVQTGKALFRMSTVTAKYSLSIGDVYFDKEKQNFVVFGEYFDKKDKEMKSQSLGFMYLIIDMQGKIVGEKINSWATEISKVTPMNEKGKFEGLNARILFHETIRTDDGQIFVVGEQYKKVASGAGIALQALSIVAGGGSAGVATSQINVYNLVIFQFNTDFSIMKVHLFEKDKNVVTLPEGATLTSSKLLSYYVKSVGGFDFLFSQVSSDKSTFNVSYINYDREKGTKAKNILGTVVYTPEKKFVLDKMPLDRKSTSFFVYRAKEGYVMISEYNKKLKTLESRLEKINY